MSSKLPQHLANNKKVASLPADLKKIAEEMLVEKLGIKEEVKREKSRDPFPGENACGVPGCFNSGCQPPMVSRCERPRNQLGFDPRFGPSYIQRTSLINLDAVIGLLRQADVRGGDQRRREFFMGRWELEWLTTDPRLVRGMEYDSIFGIPIKVQGDRTGFIDLVQY